MICKKKKEKNLKKLQQNNKKSAKNCRYRISDLHICIGIYVHIFKYVNTEMQTENPLLRQ